MKMLTIISEDYFYFFESFINQFQKRDGTNQVYGIGMRRSTINELIKKSNVQLIDYIYLNELEQNWLCGKFDQNKINELSNLLGHETLRDLIISDREFGWGFLSGGVYARTPMRNIVESNQDKRWIYICNMMDYYRSYLQENNIDFVFMSEITHIWELGLYHAAKSLGIACTVPFYSRFGDCFVLTDNPYNKFTNANKVFDDHISGSHPLKESFLQAAKDYLTDFRNKPKLVEYSAFFKKKALKQAKWRFYLKTLAIDLVRWLFILLKLKGTRGFIRQRNGLDILMENYNCFHYSRKAIHGNFFTSIPENYSYPYVYFPLHYDPEASTMVFAPKFANQLSLIEQIARSLPAGFKLLVKEHIPNTGRRPKGFYEKIKQIPDVVLVSPFEDNFRLIQNANLVATITGTAGWEAILLKKPCIVFGENQYSHLKEGFFYSQNMGNLSEDLQQAMKIPAATDTRLTPFIAATMQEGVKLPLHYFSYAHYGIDGKELYKDYDMTPFIEKALEYV